MESALGGSLKSLVKSVKIDSKALDCEIAKFFTAEVISALQFLHRNNIVYRDVHPRNILITFNGHIKLSDFGCACLIKCIPGEHPDPITGIWEECASSFVGSYEYISPEVGRIVQYYRIYFSYRYFLIFLIRLYSIHTCTGT